MKKERESFLRNFIEAFTKGDIFTKLSILIFGTGYVARGQYVKAVILQIVQVLFFVFTFGFSLNYMSKLGTLGTIQREEIFDPKTLSKVVNDYDNSLMILLCGVIGIIFIFLYILLSLSTPIAEHRVPFSALKRYCPYSLLMIVLVRLFPHLICLPK